MVFMTSALCEPLAELRPIMCVCIYCNTVQDKVPRRMSFVLAVRLAWLQEMNWNNGCEVGLDSFCRIQTQTSAADAETKH